MLLDGANITKKLDLSAELCILGGGVAGITLANELKNVFGSIVVIESGAETYEQATQELYAAEKTHDVYPDPTYSRMRFLGGSSNHWENNTTPFLGIDFERRDWIQNSGWPISLKDVQPYYPKAAQYCGVGADGYDPTYWAGQLNRDFPFKVTDAVNMRMSKFAAPATRFFERHGKALRDAKNVSVYMNSNVVDVSFDEQAGKIQEVRFTTTGEVVHRIAARVFILCFGGIENARMLLYFNQKYNNKMGNKFDNVGRYFMDHPTLRPANIHTDNPDLTKNFDKVLGDKYVQAVLEFSEAGLRSHRITNSKFTLIKVNHYDMSDGISSFHILRERLLKGSLPDDPLTHLSHLVLDIDMVAEAISRKSLDVKLFDHANEFAGFQAHAMMEQTPSKDNRIRLGQQKDRLGIPRILIDWRLEQNDIDMMWNGILLLGKEFGKKSLGRVRMLKEQSQRLFSSQLGFGHHHMGTTRMADDERTGVVDKNQLVFGTKNLFVAGSSVFTTGSHVPPTLTIVALTLRLADHLTSMEKRA